MLAFVVRRILFAVPILLGVSLLVFALVHMAPGDAADMLIPPDASKEVADSLRQRFGLDQPLYIQYGSWIRQVLIGDFGVSIFNNRPVLPEMLESFRNTLLIAIPAAILGFSLGIVLGGVAAFNRDRFLDRLCSVVAVAGVSVPNYWVAIVLVATLSVGLDLLPALGMGGDGLPTTWEDLRFLVLPIVSLSLIPMGIIARVVRAVVLDILSQEFVSAQYAKGLTDRRVLVHVIKNAAPPTLAVMGVQLGYLLGGSIIIEAVFNWPGTGGLLNLSIFRRDIPTVSAIVLMLATIFVVINVLVDILQAVIDPRIRR